MIRFFLFFPFRKFFLQKIRGNRIVIYNECNIPEQIKKGIPMKQKTALITGASRGIGRAAAEAFAKDGWHLVLNCKTNGRLLSQLCVQLTETCPVQCLPIQGDVSDYAFCRELFAAAEERFGGVDLLINNAGISHVGLLSQMSPRQWEQVIGTNLSSAFYCAKLAIPYMLAQKSGHILNVSSVWGQVGASCEAAYSASKGGLNALTRALAKELAPSGIRVNAIACGLIDTDMNRQLDKKDLQALTEEIPAGRAGTPKEAADLMLQLVHSPAYLTGQIVTMDGGWT